MNKKSLNQGRSVIAITISIAVIALLLRVTIKKVIEIGIQQNEAGAQTNLKLISAALENYSNDNKDVYPDNFSLLTDKNYLDINYFKHSPIKGYNYTCLRLEAAGYNCSALPSKCNFTGRMTFTVSTGGSFISEKCDKTE